MMGTEDCVNEQTGAARRRSAAATPTSASPECHSSNTQNALIKSLLNKLRLSGSKLKHDKFEKFNFSIPQTGTLDTPLNQGKQLDQRHGRLSAGVSPFELARVLPPSQRPSPTAHTPTTSMPLDPAACDRSAADPLPGVASGNGGPLVSAGGSGNGANAGASGGGFLAASGGSGTLSFQASQTHQPINAQRSLEAALAGQQSWGSPRSEAFRSSEAGVTAAAAAAESARLASITQLPLPSGLGLGGPSASSSLGGTGGSSGGGAASARRPSRPSIVPPLDLGKLGSKDGARRNSKQSLPNSPMAANLPAPGAASSGAGAGITPAPPLTPHQYQQQLAESLADLDEELEGWAAPARWNPSNQGRWYLYPPIGRKDVSPVEQLVESLSPSQAAAVVLLWRQYAAARYSAELMAGRAVRLCRELGHELNECRAEVDERTQRHADHAAQLGKAIMRLQQQLEEARRAAAAATLAAAQAAAQAQASEAAPGSIDQQPHHQHHLRLQLSQSLPGAPAHLASSPARRASLGTAAASPAGSVRGSANGGIVPPGALAQLLARDKERTEREKRLASGRSAAGAVGASVEGGGTGAAEGLQSLAADNEDLAVQLEQMRSLFLEAHEDSRALREALIEVDEQNMQLYEQSNGLRRHASAVLKENDSLRQEVAQLRAMLTTTNGGGKESGKEAATPAIIASTPVPNSAHHALASAAATVELLLPSAAPGGGGGGKTSAKGGYGSYGGSGGKGYSNGGVVLGSAAEHVISAASPQPPRRPPAPSGGIGAISGAGAMTPTSGKGQHQHLMDASRTASARRGSGMMGAGEGSAAAPPLPPSRVSARPVVSQRAPAVTSGGRSAKDNSGAAPVPLVGLGAPHASGPAEASSIRPVSSISFATPSGAANTSASERTSGRAVLTEALATDGAVVVVQATRRVVMGQGAPPAAGVAAAIGSSQALAQLRNSLGSSGALGATGKALPSSFSTGAASGKMVGSAGGASDGGGGGSGAGSGRLQSSVEERLLKAQAAVAQARAAMAAAMSSQF